MEKIIIKAFTTRIVIACVLGLTISIVLAQGPASSIRPPNFDAEEVAGIHYYKVPKVQKRLKLEKIQIDSVTQFLNSFNFKMEQISLKNAVIFRNLNEDFDKNVQLAISQRNPAVMDGVKARIKNTIPPIAEEVQREEEDLTTRLKEILSGSQFEKWLKYQRRSKPRTNFNQSP